MPVRRIFQARPDPSPLRWLLALVLLLAGLAAAPPAGTASAGAPLADDQTVVYRPGYHFTPQRNFMNDPNGLIRHGGRYHLFFQYNPYGSTAGNGSWGHATSTDLVHWTERPLAIPADEREEVWSGSVVHDRHNTSGLGTVAKPPLVAIYTRRDKQTGVQSQALASSGDGGTTWTKHAGNPVLDIGSHDFRDPKVFWDSERGRWVMTVALSVERTVEIYTSPDLRTWTHRSSFGPANAADGVWECPDLFPLTVPRGKHRAPQRKWVLTVSVTGKTQYFVGDFDGARFSTPDEAYTPPAGTVLADFEQASYPEGWTTTGTAFGSGPAAPPVDVTGHQGERAVDSFGSGDHETGTLTSAPFMIDRRHLNLLVGGGRHPHVEGGSTAPPVGDLLADFESEGTELGWTGTGDLAGTANSTWSNLPGQVGRGVLDTCVGACDPATGTISSPSFTLTKGYVNLLVAGGNHPLSGPEPTAVSLVVDGDVVASATGDGSPNMDWRSWDVRAHVGKEAHVEVTDQRTADWGHLMIDHIVQSDAPAPPWNQETTVNLVVDGVVVRTATGRNAPSLDWMSWDLADLRGKQATLRIVDEARGGWGHLYVDQVMLADRRALSAAQRTRWVDHGADNYAGVTFNGLPDERRVFIGWLGNWDYANEVPTAPWRGAQSIARDLGLRTVDGRLALVQSPVPELDDALRRVGKVRLAGVRGERAIGVRGVELVLDAVLRPRSGTSRYGLDVRAGDGQRTRIAYDARTSRLSIDRRASGEKAFSPLFAGVQDVPLRVDGALELRILVDRSSVEVFAEDGRVAMSDVIFPDLASNRVRVFAEGGAVDIDVSAARVR